MREQYGVGDVVLNNWKLERLIGEGSFGCVFEAWREDFGVTYKAAIKVITIPNSQAEIVNVRAEMDDESVTDYFRSFVEEIVREFALMAQLKGTANVVNYEDHTVIQHDDGISWDIIIRMELLTPLLDHITKQKPVEKDVIRLGMDICRALELCQKFNVLHRDIKPENIFVSSLGDYKLGDFGIARTAERTMTAGSKRGTYTYMAPEVYHGSAYGSAVDIYSLGIVMYRLLNDNRLPFLPEYPAPITHSNREEALTKRLRGLELPAPKNADDRLSEIVLKACAYDPKDRYKSPMLMRGELEALFTNASREVPINSPVVLKNTKTDDNANLSENPVIIQNNDNKIDMLEKTESIFGNNYDLKDVQEKPKELEDVQEKPMVLEIEPTESIFGDIKPISDSSTKKKKRKWPIALGIFAILVLASVGFLSWSDNPFDINSLFLQDDSLSHITIRGTRHSKSLTSLVLHGMDLTDEEVEPLRYMSNLEYLDLSNNQIIDLTPISELSNLVWVDLAGNPILDWSPVMYVSEVVGMNYVSIGNERYSVSLTELDLSNLNLTDEDIIPLRHMRNLEVLRIGGNQISDLTSISNLTRLEVLNLSDNNIENLTPLSNLVNLDRVALTDNPIIDWLPVLHVPYVWGVDYIIVGSEQYSTSLTELDLIDLNLIDSDILLLRHMTNLTTLRLNDNQISDLTPLSNLTSLETLNLSNNNIEDLTPLSGLLNLDRLALADNFVRDWLPVAHVPNIWGVEYITIRDEQYSVSLTELDLVNLGLTDAEIVLLRHMDALTVLRLNNNRISDLTPLSDLVTLEVLNLSNNNIEDLSPLSNLAALYNLALEYNPVHDWRPVAHVPNIWGHPPIYVPNVVRLGQASATEALQELGFVVNVRLDYSNTVARGVVISQNPATGTSLERGDTVTIIVSRGRRAVHTPVTQPTPAAPTPAAPAPQPPQATWWFDINEWMQGGN